MLFAEWARKSAPGAFTRSAISGLELANTPAVDRYLQRWTAGRWTPGQGTVRLRSPRWQVGQIAPHSLSVGADSLPSTGTGRRAFTQMEQRRRRYAAVSCRRRASTLLGSGRLAG